MTWPSDQYRKLAGIDPDPADDLTILPEDITAYHAEHPDTFPGIDVTPIIAVERARQARPDLSPQEAAILMRAGLEQVSGRGHPMARELVDYVNAHRPIAETSQRRHRSLGGVRWSASPGREPARRGRPPLEEADVLSRVQGALDSMRAAGAERPTREAIAESMGIDPSTLRRYISRYPALRGVLPVSGRSKERA